MTYIGDRHHPYTLFDYTRTRQRDGPDQYLKNFHGYLQADAFAGYDALYVDPQCGIREVACWAHARRKFDEACRDDSVRAAEALAFIRCLYDVEDQAVAAAAGDPDRLEAERLRRRQSVSKPLLEQFHVWLVAQQDRTETEVLRVTPRAARLPTQNHERQQPGPSRAPLASHLCSPNGYVKS